MFSCGYECNSYAAVDVILGFLITYIHSYFTCDPANQALLFLIRQIAASYRCSYFSMVWIWIGVLVLRVPLPVLALDRRFVLPVLVRVLGQVLARMLVLDLRFHGFIGAGAAAAAAAASAAGDGSAFCVGVLVQVLVTLLGLFLGTLLAVPRLGGRHHVMPGMTCVRAGTISTPTVPDTVILSCHARENIVNHVMPEMTSCHARGDI